MVESTVCAHCGRQIEAQLIQLWDGRPYCYLCVEEACPGLWEYAQTHDRLEETLPPRYMGALILPAIGCVVVVAIFTAQSINAGRALAPSLLYLSIFCIPLFVIYAALHVLFVKYGRANLSVRDGILTVTRQAWGHHVDNPLVECSWHVGSLYEDRIAGISHWPSRRRVVVINYKGSQRWLGRKKYVAVCGSDMEMRARWIAFFKLAGVPRKHR